MPLGILASFWVIHFFTNLLADPNHPTQHIEATGRKRTGTGEGKVLLTRQQTRTG